MMRITSNEKAVMGGLTSALFSIIVQLLDKPTFTLRDVEVAVAAYAATHLAVWATTNTPKPPVAPNPNHQ